MTRTVLLAATVLRDHPLVNVPREALAALTPFTDLDHALGESHVFRDYADAYGGPSLDELYAEAVSVAARWCRGR